MSQPDHHDAQDGPSGLLPAFILCALLLGGLGWPLLTGHAPSSTSSHEDHTTAAAQALAFPPLEISSAKIQEVINKGYTPQTSFLQDPKVVEFIAQAKIQQDHMFTTTPIPTQTVKELIQAHEYKLGEALTAVPKAQDLMRIADMLQAECEPALEQLMEAVRAGQLTLEQARKDPNIAQWATYRQSCGNLLDALYQFKLIDDKAQYSAPYAKALIPILQRHRFASSLVTAQPINKLLSPQELTIFWRWRIESAQAFTLEQRQEALNRADKSLLPYHWLKAQAILHIEAKQYDKARKDLQLLQASEPANPHIAKWMTALPPA